MPNHSRTLRVALLTLLTSFPAATALAQEATETPGADSGWLMALSVAVCLLIGGLLAHTAYRMSHLE